MHNMEMYPKDRLIYGVIWCNLTNFRINDISLILLCGVINTLGLSIGLFKATKSK